MTSWLISGAPSPAFIAHFVSVLEHSSFLISLRLNIFTQSKKKNVLSHGDLGMTQQGTVQINEKTH